MTTISVSDHGQPTERFELRFRDASNLLHIVILTRPIVESMIAILEAGLDEAINNPGPGWPAPRRKP